MALPQVKHRYSVAEYYAIEHEAPYKSDYYDGEIFDMSGGTSAHSLIVSNVGGELRQRLKGKPCRHYESNMRLKIEVTGLRTYPDASVYCEEIKYDPEDPRRTTAVNPTLIVEVLSPTTEAYDRGFKARNYRQVATLQAYVLVAQDRPHVELYVRQMTGAWGIQDAVGLDAVVRFDAIGVDLPLAEIYDGVDFADAAVVSPPPGM